MSADARNTVSLTGKTVVIFGGTSGIGLAAARQATTAGAQVIVIGTSAARAEKVAAEYGLAGWRAANMSKPDTIDAALATISSVDHLVLLAGSFVVGKVLEADVSLLRQPFDERVWGAIHALRVLGPRLAKGGSVTFVSGELTDRPNAHGTAVLGAALAAMEALARGLALEIAPIRVNTLSPGPIETPLLDKAMGEGRDAYVESRSAMLPQRRFGTPEEAGAAVLFLMTNRWMNGATLNLDGGSRLV